MEMVKWKMDNFDGSSVDTSKFHINNLKIYAPGRVAEGGRLSANAKNAFNSFVATKKGVFAGITKIATKNVVFAHICKHMGSFSSEPGQKEAVLHLKFNKSFIKSINRDKS